MRFLAVCLVVVLLMGAAWSKYVTQGGLVDYYDKNPRNKTAPAALYYLGKGYEVVSSHEKTLGIYGRVVERYPKSPYAMEAAYGEALALERLRRYPEAIEKYELFLESYPNSKYVRSVRNNIQILKSR